MRTNISQFESVGYEYANKLKKTLKIKNVDDFVKYPIEFIHEKSGIEIKRLEQFSDLFDLFRVPNLSARETELLYNANINSVTELSHRQAIRIYYKLKNIDEETYFIILQLPTFAKIDEWIYFAKMLTKRIKIGLNIPIILFPMVSIRSASELKNFKIFTANDFITKEPNIPKIWRMVDMKRRDYKKLKRMINFVKIPGVDIYFAKIFQEAKIKDVIEFKELEADAILEMVKLIQDQEVSCIEKIDIEFIKEIQKKIMEEEF
ncbi:DUF4332 domain-containing protein [Promethearchaeum syntrophicum]|uniref:DUF4332 domain-containing protein n=1 Tax=Promethearchaeum syntrophicum TaxID=2594042 RepID=A0A5B9D761_9ARCH|nr:DUF4332 domain-containing protein [Candidatus Prometheoarchaeum syntrophicum]QEE14680.1 hypothetical protein DSAG12_00493 [Candidatus Prometheoarchaeum syntrophicum]